MRLFGKLLSPETNFNILFINEQSLIHTYTLHLMYNNAVILINGGLRMFTNKNKLIAFIALIVVVVLLASTGIALIADNANKKANEEAQAKIDAANKAIEDAANKITELQGALDDLQSALNSSKSDLAAANKKIEDLTGSKISIEDWDNCTEAAYPAIQKVVKAHRDIVDNAHLFDVEDEEARAELVKTSETATDKAIVAILRARTNAEVDAIVDDYFDTVDDIRANRYDEELAKLIDAAKADEGPVFGRDDDKVKEAVDYLGKFDEVEDEAIWNSFKNFGERDLVEEVAQLQDALYKSQVAQLVEKFLGCEIPETVVHKKLEGGNFDKVTAARDAYDALVAVCKDGETEANAIEGVADHLDKLVVAEDRVGVLTNAGVKADEINAQIEGFDGVLSVVNKTQLAEITDSIAAWKTDYEIDEVNEPLVNEAGFKTKSGKFAEDLETLKKLHDDLHTAIDAIGDEVTISSGDDIKAAKDKLDELLKKCGVDSDIEGLLGLDHTVQSDRDAINVKDELHGIIVANFDAIRALIVLIDENTFVHADLEANLADLADKIAAYVTEGHDAYAVIVEVDNTKAEDDEHDYVALYAKILLFPAKKQAYDRLETIKATYIAGEGREDVRDRIVVAYEAMNKEILNANTKEALDGISTEYITAQFEAAKAGTTTEK